MFDLKLMLMVWLSLIDPAMITAFKVAAGFIIADVVLGWIFAFAKGEFDVRLSLKFIKTNAFPYLGALFVLMGMSTLIPEFKPVFYFVCTLVAAKFGVEAIKDKLVRYFKPTSDPPV